jgi:hypothetical protein
MHGTQNRPLHVGAECCNQAKSEAQRSPTYEMNVLIHQQVHATNSERSRQQSWSYRRKI